MALAGVLGFAPVPGAAAGAGIDYEPLARELASYLDGRTGRYAVAVLDIGSGASLEYNALETFHGASTFKVPLNLYLYRGIAAGRIDPHACLTYDERHFEGGTGYLQREPFGTVYRVERLARDSIVYSDNVATNMLLEYLGRRNVTDYMRLLGGTAVSDRSNVTCAADLVLYFQALLEFSREYPEQGERLLGYLRNTVYRDRIPAPLPPGVRVAHKTGDWPAQGSWHDAGIVEHPSRPYIIAVLSKDAPGYAYACATIREISSRVWEYQSDPYFKLTVNVGEEAAFLPAVLNRDGRFLVPVRAFVELLPGCAVDWVAEERAVLVLNPAGEVGLRLAGGDTDLVYRAGRAFLPLRRAGEALGYEVHWDPEAGTVRLALRGLPDAQDPDPAETGASGDVAVQNLAESIESEWISG